MKTKTKIDDPNLNEEELQSEQEQQQELPEGVDDDEAAFAAAFDDNYDETGNPRQEQERDGQEEVKNQAGDEEREPVLETNEEKTGEETPAKPKEQVTTELKGQPTGLEDAPDAVREYIKDLENRVRSHQGQVVPVQQQNSNLRREQKSLKDQVDELLETNRAQEVKLEKFGKYKSEFPDEAEAITEMVSTRVDNAIRGVMETVEQRVGAQLGDLQLEQAKRNRQSEIDLIMVRHPDLDKVTQDADFYDWLKTQPQNIQHMVAVNIRENVVATDMNWALDHYKSDRGVESQGKKVETETPVEHVQKPRDTSPPSGGSGVKVPMKGQPQDDEERFAAAYDASYGG